MTARMPSRYAAWTANLILLKALVSGDFRFSELVESSDDATRMTWHDQAVLWSAESYATFATQLLAALRSDVRVSAALAEEVIAEIIEPGVPAGLDEAIAQTCRAVLERGPDGEEAAVRLRRTWDLVAGREGASSLVIAR
ncbi:hypothetical protein [Actinoplanes subglobosus]|uniref:Uncharacterized protein n=1 Tax=Actinoplanes subglobosus TaxID=1547892 RepID=A0ABV8J9K8_9ACTN